MSDMQAIEYVVNTYHPLFMSCPNHIIFIRDVYYKHKVAQGILARLNAHNYEQLLKYFRVDIPRYMYLTRRKYIIEQYRTKNNQVLKVLNSDNDTQDVLLNMLSKKIWSTYYGK